jgi:hypothetical protein
MVFVEHVVPAEPGHGPECRAAAYPHLVGLLQQPLPEQNAVVALVFMDVEAQKRAFHLVASWDQ